MVTNKIIHVWELKRINALFIARALWSYTAQVKKINNRIDAIKLNFFIKTDPIGINIWS